MPYLLSLTHSQSHLRVCLPRLIMPCMHGVSVYLRVEWARVICVCAVPAAFAASFTKERCACKKADWTGFILLLLLLRRSFKFEWVASLIWFFDEGYIMLSIATLHATLEVFSLRKIIIKVLPTWKTINFWTLFCFFLPPCLTHSVCLSLSRLLGGYKKKVPYR